MNSEWVILVWALVSVIFLVKIPAVRELFATVRKMSAIGIICMVLSLGYFAHVSYTKEPLSTNQASQASQNYSLLPTLCSLSEATSSLPEFWKDDPTDTDEDGIPDLWEKWTHGKKLVADSDLDRDDDGLSDLEEFWNQTDPRTADTDGDGLSDAFEVSNGMNPLVQSDFAIDEPDENANGVPDLWEGSAYSFGFSDANADGFDDATVSLLSTVASWNFDVKVIVTSSRTTALVWGEGEGEGIVLPPCTNLGVRIRLDARQENVLRLLPAPEGVEASGLWKARLKLDWDSRRSQTTDRNRVRTGDGTIIAHDEASGEFVGFIESAPADGGGLQPSSFGGASSGINRLFNRVGITLSSGASRVCRIHGPDILVTASLENVSLPLKWSINGGSPVLGGTVFNAGHDSVVYVTCAENTNAIYVATDTKTFASGQCQPDTLEIRGAAWGSSHNPSDANDHLPESETIHTYKYASNCPSAEKTTVTLGFKHVSPVKTRNLVLVPTSDPKDLSDHCMPMTWSQGRSINLYSLVDPVCASYLDDISFTTDDGEIDAEGNLRHPRREPSLYKPQTSCIQLKYKDESRIYDSLWIVIVGPSSTAAFGRWVSRNSDTSWTARLPQPYASIPVTSAGNPVDPEPWMPHLWGTPHRIASYLHHDAAFEMRSAPVNPGGHGHQATYDSSGELILTAIAAGTADAFAPYDKDEKAIWLLRHRNEDVFPFILALQLDGNPGKLGDNPFLSSWDAAPMDLSRPCLYKNGFVDQYISLRPIAPTGVQP